MVTEMSFKSFLKKFLPIPANGFMREVNNIHEKIDNSTGQLVELLNGIEDESGNQINAVGNQINNVNNQISKHQDEFYRQISALNDRIDCLNGQINSQNELIMSITKLVEEIKKEPSRAIDTYINPSAKNRVYKSEFVREFYKDTFNMSVFDSEDYGDRVLNLVSGLDEESIYTVSRNLCMLKSVMSFSRKNMWLQFYTQEEQTSINNEMDKFNRSKVKLSDDLYYWNGYLLPLDNFDYGVFYDKHGIHKIDNIEAIADKHIIDVGAFIGDSALIFSPLTNKSVHCFEASKSNYQLLEKTIEINKLHNVVANNSCLSSTNGEQVSLNVSLTTPHGSNILNNSGLTYDEVETVSTLTLDTYVEENDLEVGLIKTDIEGAEQDFLKGAMRTIVKQKPVLMISIYHNANDFFDIKPMIESLDLGYKFKIHRPTLISPMLDTVLVAEVPANER